MHFFVVFDLLQSVYNVYAISFPGIPPGGAGKTAFISKINKAFHFTQNTL